MKRGAPDHFKMKRLARALQIPLYAANGLVMRLLHFVADHAPRGDVGRFDDQDLADACCWDREPSELVSAFVEAGWLDHDPQYRFALHDWFEHAEDAVHARVARERQWFVTGQAPRLRKLEEKERAKAIAFYAEHQAPTAAETAAAGSREPPNGGHSAPDGASPLPLPPPLPEEEIEEGAPGGAAPAGREFADGEARGDPERWAGVLSKERGSREEKLRFLERELVRIEAEAISQLKPGCRDAEAIRAKTSSLVIAWWRQSLAPRAGRKNGRVAASDIWQHEPEASA